MNTTEAIATALTAMRADWTPEKIRAVTGFGPRDLVQRAYRALLGTAFVRGGRYGIDAADPAIKEAVTAAATADWDAVLAGPRRATEADVCRVLAMFVDDDTGAPRPQEVEDIIDAVGAVRPEDLDNEIRAVLACFANTYATVHGTVVEEGRGYGPG